MARNDPQMNLRLPAELKEQIEEAAAKNNRTLTAEVVARLQQTFDESAIPKLSDYAVGTLIQELLTRFGPNEISIRIGKQDDHEE